MQYLLIYVSPFLPSGIPWGIHLITRLRCSALRHYCLLWRLLTSHGKSFSTTGGIFRPIPVSVRPRGISCQSFLVYLPDLRLRVTVAFRTSLSIVSLSATNALISDFCSSGYDFAIPSSRLHLTIQTLGVALGFVGNYAPCGLSPQTDGMPVIQ